MTERKPRDGVGRARTIFWCWQSPPCRLASGKSVAVPHAPKGPGSNVSSVLSMGTDCARFIPLRYALLSSASTRRCFPRAERGGVSPLCTAAGFALDMVLALNGPCHDMQHDTSEKTPAGKNLHSTQS